MSSSLPPVRPKRIPSHETGAELVEFGLILLPLFAILFMALDLAWILCAWACIQEGAREGVRYAVTGQTGSYACQDAAIRSVVQQYSFGFVNASNVNSMVAITYYAPNNLGKPVSGQGSNRGGNVVKVSVVNLPVNPLAPLWQSSAPITLSASSSDVVEGSPASVPPCR